MAVFSDLFVRATALADPGLNVRGPHPSLSYPLSSLPLLAFLPFPSRPPPPLPFPSLPPLRSRTPLIAARGSRALKLPQWFRAEPGRQTYFGAF